jgi:hypothetical protein
MDMARLRPYRAVYVTEQTQKQNLEQHKIEPGGFQKGNAGFSDRLVVAMDAVLVGLGVSLHERHIWEGRLSINFNPRDLR